MTTRRSIRAPWLATILVSTIHNNHPLGPHRRHLLSLRQVRIEIFCAGTSIPIKLYSLSCLDLLSLDDDVTESQPCPLECNCHKEFVNCSGLQFSQLPQDLPLNMVGLDLSVNLLKEIDLNALIPFTQLRELNVSHNQIQDIQKLVSRLFSFIILHNLNTLLFSCSQKRD